MNKVLHVFRKDVRYLRREIALVLVVMAGFTIAVARGAGSLSDPATTMGVAVTLLTYLLPVAWAVLIMRLIHAEVIPGSDQFWVTRPCGWKNLLAAKVMFVFVFVNLPKLVSDVVILRTYGFDLGQELGGLLWTQVLLTAVLVLPVAALSAVTSSMAQLMGVLLAVAVAIAGWNLGILGVGEPWFALEWAREYSIGLVVAVAALAIIFWQYAQRRTTVSRIVTGAAVIAAFAVLAWLPWTTAFAIQSRFSDQAIDPAAVRVAFDPDSRFLRAFVEEDGVEIHVPLRVVDVPYGMQPVIEGITAEIEASSGTVWRTGRNARSYIRSGDIPTFTRIRVWNSRPYVGSGTTFLARLDNELYRGIREASVRIRGSLYVTLYGNARFTTLAIEDDSNPVPTPGVGICSAAGRDEWGLVVNCRSAFRPKPDLAAYDYHYTVEMAGRPPRQPSPMNELNDPRPVSYSPFPAELSMVPVTQSAMYGTFPFHLGPGHFIPTGMTIRATEPVAYIVREFEIDDLRLADYEETR